MQIIGRVPALRSVLKAMSVVREDDAAGLRRRWRLAVVLAPAVVSLALGVWGIHRENTMYRDEAVTYDMAHRSVSELIGTLANFDVVHGLYYLLMNGVFKVTDAHGVGDLLLVLRLPSALAMAAAAAGVAALGQRLTSPVAGLVAGLVHAAGPDAQRYAQDARSYALVQAAVVWATYLLVRAAVARRPRAWTGYGAVALLVCLLNEFAVLAVVAHGVALLVARVPKSVLRDWSLAAGCAVAGMAPVALISSGQDESADWARPPGVAYLLGYAATSAVGVACMVVLRRTNKAHPLVAVAVPMVLLPNGLLLAVSYAKPLYAERYVLCYSIGLALLLGALTELAWRARRVRRAVLVGAIAAVVALAPLSWHLRTPASRIDNSTAVAAAAHAQAEPGDGVVFMPYLRRGWVKADTTSYAGLTDLAMAQLPSDSHTLFGTELPPDKIRSRMRATSRILVVDAPPSVPLDQASQAADAAKRQTLRRYFEICRSTKLPHARVALYAWPGRCGSPGG